MRAGFCVIAYFFITFLADDERHAFLLKVESQQYANNDDDNKRVKHGVNYEVE